MRKIHVIGINSFEFEELPLKLQNLFISINKIAIPISYNDKIKSWSKKNKIKNKNFFLSKSDSKLINWLQSQGEDVILISRGDPLWFGIGRILLENFKKEELIFYPSNTCMQQAFSKLKLPWNDANFISIHGRDSSKLVNVLKTKCSNIVIITDPKIKSLEIIKNNLLEQKLEDLYDVWLCEELGLDNEKIRMININKKFPAQISDLNIVILLKKTISIKDSKLPLFGLKDNLFKTFSDRPNLLTKKDVRVQILADLDLPEKGIIWDVGAGCGSIGLEALRLRPDLKLFCIDSRIGSKNLIVENARRLKVVPEKIIEEDINILLDDNFFVSLNKPKRVIIGGCNNETKLRLINELSKVMNPGHIVIIPIINIEAIERIRAEFQNNEYIVELNLIQTYKTFTIAEGIRLEPNNPVFLIRAEKISK